MKKTSVLICIILLLFCCACGKQEAAPDAAPLPQAEATPAVTEGFNIIAYSGIQLTEVVEETPPEPGHDAQSAEPPAQEAPRPAAQQTDTPVNMPKPTPLPPAKSDAQSMAREFARMNGLDDLDGMAEEAFLNAAWPGAGDFTTGDAGVQGKVYEAPLNMYSGTPIPGSAYQTNSEYLAAHGKAEADRAVSAAKAYIRIDSNVDFRGVNKASILADLRKMYPNGSDLEAQANAAYEHILTHELKTEGFFLSDSSLIYRASDGGVRVRGTLYKHIQHATPDVYAQLGLTQPGWMRMDAEVRLNATGSGYEPTRLYSLSEYLPVTDGGADARAIQRNGYGL